MTVGEQVISVGPDLVTKATLTDGHVIYEVETANPLYQESLLHIGFLRAGGITFSRRLSASGDVVEIHRRFARHLQTILLQSARRTPVDWRGALQLFLMRVEKTGLNWFLYGSGALAARGLDVSPGDLDFWVDDADLAGRIFDDLLIEPVTAMTGWIADKGGRAYADCIIEWLSGVYPAPEPHEQNPTTHPREERVTWQGYSVRLAPLALQLSVLERRGLSERAAKVRQFMARGGE